MFLRHGRNNDDRYKPANCDQEQAHVVQHRQEAVAKYDQSAAGPGYDEVGDVDVPGFDDKVGVENSVHLYCDVRRDRGNRSKVEDPPEEVQVACEEANNSSVLGPRCNRSPMVDAPGGRYGRCKLHVL